MSEKKNTRTIRCLTCSESWDEDTYGYEAARVTLETYHGLLCPACEPGQDDTATQGGAP